MLKSLAAAFITVIALGSLASCSGSVSVGAKAVSASDVEDQIMSQLTDADGVGPDSASCPDDLEAKVGATLTCTATSGTETVNIEAKVTSVDGTDVNFDLSQVD